MELKQHPLSAAFPSMSAEDFAALVQDVREHGQREPIMLLDGMVLDGWHRYRACIEVGVKPQKFNFDGGDPVAFVLSHNLHRRHLTPSQRAAAVVACSDYGGKGRPQKMGKDAHFPAAPKVDDLAKTAQVAPRLIKDAAVAKKAGLLNEVKDGTISAAKAAEIARGKAEKKPAKRTLDAAPAHIPDLTDADRLTEAQDTIAQLSSENDELRDRLAVESMNASEEEKTAASETIRDLRARVKTLEAELDAVKKSRDTYMRQNAEMQRQIEIQRKELKKLAKAEA